MCNELYFKAVVLNKILDNKSKHKIKFVHVQNKMKDSFGQYILNY